MKNIILYKFIEMIPIRCFSCNKLIAHKYNIFLKLKLQGMEEPEIFKILKIERICCKIIFISGFDYSDCI